VKSKASKTIRWEELQRLQFCNSSKLPLKVNVHGRCKEWVGVGWVDIGPARPTAVTVVLPHGRDL
jgi:hypothetical protein